MKTKPRLQFDPAAFLAKTGEGRAAYNYARGQVIFAQGDLADAVFYVQTGQVKLTVVSTQGKEAVVGIYSASESPVKNPEPVEHGGAVAGLQ